MGRLISDRMAYRNHYMCGGEATSKHDETSNVTKVFFKNPKGAIFTSGTPLEGAEEKKFRCFPKSYPKWRLNTNFRTKTVIKNPPLRWLAIRRQPI